MPSQQLLNLATEHAILERMKKTLNKPNGAGKKRSKTSRDSWNFKLLLGEKLEASLPTRREQTEKEANHFIDRWKNRQDYLSDPSVLKEALDEFASWVKDYGPDGTESYYYELRYAQNQTDPKIKAKLTQTGDRVNQISNNLLFFTLSLSRIAPAKQQEFLASPLLAEYHHWLEQLFIEAKYLLSEAEEKILNLESEPAYSNWVAMTEGFLAKEMRELNIKGKKVAANYEMLLTLMSHQDKKIRDIAAKNFNEILAKHADSAEAELNAILQNKKIRDQLRGYSRPDESRHLADDVSTQMVDSLLTAVKDKFGLAQRFYKLKAKLLGLPKLAYHERNVPVGKIDREISYKEATTTIKRVLAGLDPEFGAIYDRFLNHGQFDVFPKPGKAGGAFCASGLLSQPTYILLNYTNRLNDVLTIAHEVGHGINNELMRQKQNALNFGTPLATAEVASTFMEDFVLAELREKETNPKTQLALMIMKLNSDVSSIFRQVACYQFEQELHQTFRAQGYLAKQTIGQIFQKHMKEYMGSAVEQSTGAENWWVYWGHIRNFFYVYSYASGLLISKALQEKVQTDPTFIVAVKQFLAAGQAKSPVAIFADLGLDINQADFWQTGLLKIEQELGAAEKLAKKLNYKI